jgi:hypothetical protein
MPLGQALKSHKEKVNHIDFDGLWWTASRQNSLILFTDKLQWTTLRKSVSEATAKNARVISSTRHAKKCFI